MSGGWYPFSIKISGGLWPAASTLWTQMLHFAANRKLDSNQEMGTGPEDNVADDW